MIVVRVLPLCSSVPYALAASERPDAKVLTIKATAERLRIGGVYRQIVKR